MPPDNEISRRGFLLAVPALLRAQDTTTFSTGVKVVNVLATVRNKKGEIVRSLGKDDFRLDEDGRPQTIQYFSQETNLPLTLGLLVDTSGSQRRVIGEERNASQRFLRQVLREDKDLAFVIHFDREVELLQDLTSSRDKLEKALDLLETPERPRMQRRPGGMGGPGGPGRRSRGGTSLYDAVELAADELMKKQTGRKALILLSDGVDNGSKLTLSTAIEAAQRADTLAYSILFEDAGAYSMPMGGYGRRRGGMGRRPMPQRPDGKKILQRISQETGGGFFEVSKKLPLEKVFERIEEELRNQYNLGYTPESANAAGGYHKIHVSVKEKNLIVQARDGYYAG